MLSAPQNAEAQNILAATLQSLGRTEEALAAFEKAFSLPGAVAEDAMIGRASMLMEAGRKDEAVAAFRQAGAAFPRSVLALAMLVELQTCEPGNPDLGPLEACLAEGESRALPDRIRAHFALAKAYMDLQAPAPAFAHLDAGNRLQRAQFTYDSAGTGEAFRRIAAAFGKTTYEAGRSADITSSLPVFVVGMPRSGTTLIEQILSSHPQVAGAGELPALRLAVEQGMVFPGGVPALGSAQATRIGQDYLSRVAPLAQGAARLIDKMPGNFVYAGLIPLILPQARIIHARRNPVDTCLSCYTKLFGGEQPFSYDQTELGEFYGFYDEMMAHWRALLPPARFLEVSYEAVVDDLEHEARRMLAFLGLPWDAACLNFQANGRVVRTASVNQVRRALYTSAKGRGQAYKPWLGPLLEALGPGRHDHAR